MEKKSSSESIDSDQIMGLEHLTICHHESDQTHVMTSSMLSRTSSSSSSAIGDYIGTESCFDVLSDEIDAVLSEPDRDIPPPFRRREAKAAAREFPPPIPRLARTGNLPSHMPWVLTRVYTSDGRLILREEKVRHHEYFRAHRSNGRLTLQLVPLDDDELDHHHHDVSLNDEVDTIVFDNDAHQEDNDGDFHHALGVNDNEDDGGITLSSLAEQTAVDIGGDGSPGGKCLKSCFLGMRVPKIRPVLS